MASVSSIIAEPTTLLNPLVRKMIEFEPCFRQVTNPANLCTKSLTLRLEQEQR